MKDSDPRRFYSAAWRWHFYAGLYVVPFLIMLSLTGVVMMYSDFVDNRRYLDLLQVEPAGSSISPAQQMQAVHLAYPGSHATVYRPALNDTSSSEFTVAPHNHAAAAGGSHGESATELVFVDPYSGAVLGRMNPEDTLYAWAKGVHSTFFMGNVGDYLIEMAASLAVLLVASGLFMWWPRHSEGRSWKTALFPGMNLGSGQRLAWRDLHGSIGAWSSIVLLFFLISGLSWTAVWGERLVQAWSSLPAQQFAGPTGATTHGDSGHANHAEVPWALEQTPLPVSGSMAGSPGIPAGQLTGSAMDLDTVVAFARTIGFTQFRVHIPAAENAAWTIAATTIDKDLQIPGRDRIVHLDRYTGKVLAEISFEDYSLMGKAMAAGIPLHQGDLGILNLAFNTLFCTGILALCISALVMWWKRRPARSFRLVPPPLPRNLQVWKGTVTLMLVLSLLFPLATLVLVAVILADYLIMSRVSWFSSALK